MHGKFPISLVEQLGHRKFAGSVDADKEIQPSFNRLHLGNIEVKEANRITLELLTPRYVAADILKP